MLTEEMGSGRFWELTQLLSISITRHSPIYLTQQSSKFQGLWLKSDNVWAQEWNGNNKIVLNSLFTIMQLCPILYFNRFTIYMRRKPLYYVMNIMLPCLMLSLLDLLVFCLPPESGEKVSLGITVLLSFSVFLLVIADNVPQTSETAPLLGKTIKTNLCA